MERNAFFASLFSFADNYDVNSSENQPPNHSFTDTFAVDLFTFAAFRHESPIAIRKSIRQLEIQHALVVKSSELSALLKVLK